MGTESGDALPPVNRKYFMILSLVEHTADSSYRPLEDLTLLGAPSVSDFRTRLLGPPQVADCSLVS